MKITVIGAGAIGSVIAYDLSERDAVTQLQVCDASPKVLRQLESRVTSAKLRTFQVDAREPFVLEPLLKGSACVISCVSPDLNPHLAELCLKLGIHFCDMGGNEDIVEQELALSEQAQKKSIWIVPNCGLAPGLVNILCMHGIEQFDEVEEAHLRVGEIPIEPNPPFNFRFSFSAEKLIEDYTEPVSILADGKIKQVEPMTGLERIRFPKPFGELEAFYTAGGLSTLPHDLEGRVRALDYKTIRHPGHVDQMRFVFALGFADKQSIDVRTHLSYRDVLVRRMRQRLGGEHPDAILLRVLITGKKEGKRRTLVYELIDRHTEESPFTAMKRCTGFPAAAIALLIASQAVPGGGASPPERIIPKETFFDLLKDRNLRFTKRWYDGKTEVDHPADVPAGSSE